MQREAVRLEEARPRRRLGVAKIAAIGPSCPRADCAASARCVAAARGGPGAREPRAEHTASENTTPVAAGAGAAGAGDVGTARAYGCAAHGAAALRSSLCGVGGILPWHACARPVKAALKKRRATLSPTAICRAIGRASHGAPARRAGASAHQSPARARLLRALGSKGARR